MVWSFFQGTGASTSSGGTQATSTWAGLTSALRQAAVEAAFDLPPLQDDAALVRLSVALAELCHFAYVGQAGDVGSTTQVHVPLPGGGGTAVAAHLLSFREATSGHDLASPQQYGIWQVEGGVPALCWGVGRVVAFRGTASQEDALVDVNITPIPLEGEPRLQVHRGFYEGALSTLEDIMQVLQAQAVGGSGEPQPVWLTGHSLGGGYANALMLHLLAHRATAQLFAGGGGVVTFGAPMVLHSPDPSAMYPVLQALEAAAQQAAETAPPARGRARGRGRGRGRARQAAPAGGLVAPASDVAERRLQFHNFVNNSDLVPRLLGSSMTYIHECLAAMVPSILSVSALAKHYQPFGAYHFIVGKELRTPPQQRRALGAALGADAVPEDAWPGDVGDARYAEAVHRQLDVWRIWQTAYATAGRGGGTTHHSLLSYQELLGEHLAALNHPRPGGGDFFGAGVGRASAPPLEDTAQPPQRGRSEDLFRVSRSSNSGSSRAPERQSSSSFVDSMGRLAGGAAAAAASELGASLAASAAAYWRSQATPAAAASQPHEGAGGRSGVGSPGTRPRPHSAPQSLQGASAAAPLLEEDGPVASRTRSARAPAVRAEQGSPVAEERAAGDLQRGRAGFGSGVLEGGSLAHSVGAALGRDMGTALGSLLWTRLGSAPARTQQGQAQGARRPDNPEL